MNDNGVCPVCNQPNKFPGDGLCGKCYMRVREGKEILAKWVAHYKKGREI
jgi:NMD protein affecting ribosome stability and mRNA decay